MWGCCEHGNERLGYVKRGYRRNCYRLKDSAQRPSGAAGFLVPGTRKHNWNLLDFYICLSNLKLVKCWKSILIFLFPPNLPPPSLSWQGQPHGSHRAVRLSPLLSGSVCYAFWRWQGNQPHPGRRTCTSECYLDNNLLQNITTDNRMT